LTPPLERENRIEGNYIRWQAITIEQLGYAVGLLLSFSAAALGFLLTLIDNPNYNPESWTKYCMDGAGLGFIFLFCSVAVAS
jgi:hypothetical protein